jgi:hypothetical protein
MLREDVEMGVSVEEDGTGSDSRSCNDQVGRRKSNSLSPQRGAHLCREIEISLLKIQPMKDLEVGEKLGIARLR